MTNFLVFFCDASCLCFLLFSTLRVLRVRTTHVDRTGRRVAGQMVFCFDASIPIPVPTEALKARCVDSVPFPSLDTRSHVDLDYAAFRPFRPFTTATAGRPATPMSPSSVQSLYLCIFILCTPFSYSLISTPRYPDALLQNGNYLALDPFSACLHENELDQGTSPSICQQTRQPLLFYVFLPRRKLPASTISQHLITGLRLRFLGSDVRF